jgi:peptide/nickel transport system substrate-binding protein
MKKRVSLLLAVAMMLTALAVAPTAWASPDTTQKEAPILAEQVKAGALPPLEERLPVAADVMVEPNVISLGQYGGSITMQSNDNGRWSAWGYISEQSMFRFKQDGSGEVEPNVCKEFFPNEDSTVWTIKLREGMKWSDGQPFTADDVIFYYNHMSTPALNEDRTAVAADAQGYYAAYTSKPYNCYQVEKDGKKYWAKFDKVSDYEFTVTFVAPKPSFAQDVAVDNKWMFLPKHFYINYVARKDGVADDATFPLITEEQALANANKDFGKQWDSYSTMSKAIGYYHWDYAIVPQLRSFIAVKDNWNVVGETYELVRNPYFWKTDSEGRQLPYLDSVKYKIINEQDQITLAASAGDFDIIDPQGEFSVVAAALKDTHTLRPWATASWSTDETIQLNQTVKDLDKRALFQDKRFREALSICVDRNLMNETLRNGVSKPWQASVGEGLPGYDAEWSSKWTEFDVARANSLMDEITEPWDGAEGTYRKMKGTDRDVEIILTINDPSKYGDFVSLLQSAYKAIGVKLSDKVDADSRTTMLSNDVEASIEVTSVSTPALRPDSIVPMRNVAFWHSAYGKWYEDGKSEANGGIAPTGDMLKLVEAYDRMKAANGPDRDKIVAECVKEIYQLHKENVWILGYLAPLPVRNLVSNKLHNFPEGLLNVDEFRFLGLARPEQWWIEQ